MYSGYVFSFFVVFEFCVLCRWVCLLVTVVKGFEGEVIGGLVVIG